MPAALRALRRLAFAFTALVGATTSPSALASFHTFAIEQIYSNADGTIQFVVLRESFGANGEHFWAGQRFTSTHAGASKSITFDRNLPSSATARRRVLLGTRGFAELGIVTPDFEIPAGFLATDGGTLNYAGVDVVSYASLPTDGVQAINRAGAPIKNLATNFAGASGSVTPPPRNHQGVWWVADGKESGWGINFAHQGDTIFATWFTFGQDGKPTWFILPAIKTADNVYSGPLSNLTGPPFYADPFDRAQVHENDPIGNATLTFAADGASASFAYTVGAVSQVKQIVRFRVDDTVPMPVCTWAASPNLPAATNYQDLWWRPEGLESGWGINFNHEGDTIFATWYTYGADALPVWFVATARREPGSNVFSGEISSVTAGPPFDSAEWDKELIREIEAGKIRISFTDGNTATFEYTIGDVQQVKPLTRYLFAPPAATTCQ